MWWRSALIAGPMFPVSTLASPAANGAAAARQTAPVCPAEPQALHADRAIDPCIGMDICIRLAARLGALAYRLDHAHDPPSYAVESERLDRDGVRYGLGPIKGDCIFTFGNATSGKGQPHPCSGSSPTVRRDRPVHTASTRTESFRFISSISALSLPSSLRRSGNLMILTT